MSVKLPKQGIPRSSEHDPCEKGVPRVMFVGFKFTHLDTPSNPVELQPTQTYLRATSKYTVLYTKKKHKTNFYINQSPTELCTGIIFSSVYLGVPSPLSSSFLAFFVVSLPQRLVMRRKLVMHLFRDSAGGSVRGIRRILLK